MGPKSLKTSTQNFGVQEIIYFFCTQLFDILRAILDELLLLPLYVKYDLSESFLNFNGFSQLFKGCNFLTQNVLLQLPVFQLYAILGHPKVP